MSNGSKKHSVAKEAPLTSSLSTGKNLSPLNARSLGGLEYTAPEHASRNRGEESRDAMAKQMRGCTDINFYRKTLNKVGSEMFSGIVAQVADVNIACEVQVNISIAQNIGKCSNAGERNQTRICCKHYLQG